MKTQTVGSRAVAILLALTAGFAAHACSDSTAPSSVPDRPATAVFSVRVSLPTDATTRALQLTRARVVIHRADGTVAYDEFVSVPSSGSQVEVRAEVEVSSGESGEDFSVVAELVTAGGATVFRGTRAPVRGAAGASASAVNVTMQYVGPGAQAASVEITPATQTVAPGATIDMSARALTAAGAEEPTAPVYWSSLDPGVASVPNAQVGRVLVGSARGTARIRASLASGQVADATVVVVPPPASLAVFSGNDQGGSPGAPLSLPMVVRVAAADGLGVGGVPVTFVILSGGGVLSASEVVTGSDGLASVNFTFGAAPGPATIRASVPGLAGSPVVFTATSASDVLAAQLAFVSQPADAVAGTPMPPIVVEARDADGNVATGFGGVVTLALESATAAMTAGVVTAAQTAGVQLSGTLSVQAIGGVATFNNVSVSAPATSLRMRATAVGVAAAGSSSSFSAVPGTATALAFVSQPANIVSGNPLPTINVEARDQLGNLVSSFSGVVTLSIDGSPAGVTLQGSSALAATGGVAAFAGLTVTGAGASLRLAATAGGISGSALSSTFSVTQPVSSISLNPATVSFAALRTAPSPAPAAVQLTSAGTVSELVVGTIAYGGGQSGWLAASLSATTTPSTLTLTATTGALPVGTFNASVPVSGAGGVATSLPVSLVISALPATQLVVTTEPAGAGSGTSFVTQPVIELRDATGARVMTASNAVTASRASGSGTLVGTVTRSAVQGRVTFTDLRINGTGAHTLGFAASGLTGTTSASFTVNAALSTTQVIPSITATVGTTIPSAAPVTASGGVQPYTFARSGGVLPSGLSFNSTNGELGGTPTTSLTTRTYTVTVTDAAGATSSKTFQLTVNGPLSTTLNIPSAAGTINLPLPTFVPVTAEGGTAPYSYAITSGSLPSGLSISSSTGAVSGTPTAVFGPTTLTVTASDASGSTSSKTFSLTINPAPATTQAVATKVGTANAALPSFTPVTVAGGTTPYTFALSGGSLPSGMTFNNTSGLVSGAPTAPLAATTFTVAVTDAVGAASSKSFQLTVNPPLVTAQMVGSVTGTVGIAIPDFTPVSISGGTPPYTRALGGTLPTGMSFDASTGQVSGTPTAPRSLTTYTMFATDAVGATSSKSFQMTVNPPLTTTQAVPSVSGTVGVVLGPVTPVTAAGGTPPLAFALTGGSLPAGLTFSTSTGEIDGTPAVTFGATVFTVTVTDAIGAASAKTFSLTIGAGLTTTVAVPSTVGTVGVAVPSFTPVTASGGATPYTFALGGGALPSGMSFSAATGEVTGTPTAPLALTNFIVTVTDAGGANSSKSFALTVNAALQTNQAVPNTTGVVNEVLGAFTPVTASGGVQPYSFALSGGSLPSGLSFSTSTGQISGTPTATLATTQFTVTVTDNEGATSAKTFNLTIEAAAPDGVVLNVGPSSTETISVGQQLAIPILVDMTNAGGADIASITVRIEWDPARFSFVSQSAGNWGSVVANTSQTGSGVLVLSGFDFEGTTSSFTLRNMTLSALSSGAATTVTATVETAANEAGSAVTVTARNLTVTINP